MSRASRLPHCRYRKHQRLERERSWTYRGSFFTDEDNTTFGGDPEGENGEAERLAALYPRKLYNPRYEFRYICFGPKLDG